MPIGNGDVTSGVWVDGDTGDLRMYISKSDVFDENSQPVKTGILRLTFDPPLPYPSDEAFAYLWVHDHLLYPLNTNLNVTGHSRQGSGVPLWIPLPPRALNADLSTIEHGSAAPLASYEVRLQYVCRHAAGCGRKISLRWATFDPDAGAAPFHTLPLTPAAVTDAAADVWHTWLVYEALWPRLQQAGVTAAVLAASAEAASFCAGLRGGPLASARRCARWRATRQRRRARRARTT